MSLGDDMRDHMTEAYTTAVQEAMARISKAIEEAGRRRLFPTATEAQAMAQAGMEAAHQFALEHPMAYVICDESNNTPETVARGEVNATVAVTPWSPELLFSLQERVYAAMNEARQRIERQQGNA